MHGFRLTVDIFSKLGVTFCSKTALSSGSKSCSTSAMMRISVLVVDYGLGSRYIDHVSLLSAFSFCWAHFITRNFIKLRPS